jgi:hypothetical protein
MAKRSNLYYQLSGFRDSSPESIFLSIHHNLLTRINPIRGLSRVLLRQIQEVPDCPSAEKTMLADMAKAGEESRE